MQDYEAFVGDIMCISCIFTNPMVQVSPSVRSFDLMCGSFDVPISAHDLHKRTKGLLLGRILTQRLQLFCQETVLKSHGSRLIHRMMEVWPDLGCFVCAMVLLKEALSLSAYTDCQKKVDYCSLSCKKNRIIFQDTQTNLHVFRFFHSICKQSLN